MTSRGFTLLEIVLAIGLTGVLLALLTTAIDLYLVRVDVHRSKVEAGQLARTLLGQIADDIRDARYYAPPGTVTTQTGSNASSSAAASSGSESANQVQGIFGTATELRIDRGARWNWNRTTRDIDPTEATPASEMPLTVGYVFNDGTTMLAEQLAALGIRTESSLTGYAGLYRQQSPTPAWLYRNNTTGINLAGNSTAEPELLAPEVLALEFSYFDGQQFVASWDSASQDGLPRAIEIRLTLLMEPYDLALAATQQEREIELNRSENEAKYSLFVRLPERRQPPNAGGQRSSGGAANDNGVGGAGGSEQGSGGSDSGN